MNPTKIQKKLLANLIINHYVGNHRTFEDSAVRCFPKHMRGNAKAELHDLIRKGYVLTHTVRWGTQIAINPQKLREVYEILGF